MAVGDDVSKDARERILQAATRVFAALGYDATTSRLIADTAGVDVATVADQIGRKREVYLAVMERAFQTQRPVIDAAVAEFTPDRAGVYRLIDRYLDLCVAHPEVPALWIHRWLSDAADIAQLEDRYVRPLFAMVVDAVRPVAAPGVDVEYSVLTVIWCVHGFIQGGVYDAQGQRKGQGNPRTLERFRAHLKRLFERSLGLDS